MEAKPLLEELQAAVEQNRHAIQVAAQALSTRDGEVINAAADAMESTNNRVMVLYQNLQKYRIDNK
jgi:hypothetical protein